MGSSLKQKLNDDLRQAMRDRNQLKVSVLRLLLSAVHNAEIAKQTEFADGDILGVVAREIKQRHESIEAFKKGNRQDLVDKEQAELAMLKEYMPEQMTRDEVVAEARKVIDEMGAGSPGDKGKVMQKLMAQLKGKADGRMVNEVVTGLLAS